MMKAVIMAGGKGTRLVKLNSDIPKPMFLILGRPILEHQIESLKRSGIDDITIIVGHLKEAVKNYFEDGSKFEVRIRYIEEQKPLGTAGALYYLREEIDDFLLIFGDLIFDIDFNRFMNFHKHHGAGITLFGHPNSHPYDSDIIMTDKECRVTGIMKKNEERTSDYHNFVNAGIYCINPTVLKRIDRPEKLDLEKSLVTGCIKQGNVYAYKSTEYIKDMGTPERLESVVKDIKNGVVSGRSLRRKQKAVFLDRDGIINEYVDHLRDIDQFRLLAGISEAIKRINSSEYIVIVVTNQPVIARDNITLDGLDKMHRKMETELGKAGAYIDDIFFCPPYSDKGDDDEIHELEVDYECRKSKTKMLVTAAKRYNIDLSASWYIGDTTMDIQTGNDANMKTILVKTGETGQDGRHSSVPDYIVNDMNEAVDVICNGKL